MPRLRSPVYFARCAVITAAVVAISAVGAQPAQADTGTTGSYTGASCGWYASTESMLSLWDDKIVRINLPSVSGVSDSQLVWAYVQFAQPSADGSMAAYRTGWFYTSPGSNLEDVDVEPSTARRT